MVLSFCLGLVHLGWLVFLFKYFFYKYMNLLCDCELDTIHLSGSNITGGEQILSKLSWKCMHLVFQVLAQL